MAKKLPQKKRLEEVKPLGFADRMRSVRESMLITDKETSKQKKCSQQDFAKMAGVADKATVSRWENDAEDQTPNAGQLCRIASQTGIDLHWLITGQDYMIPDMKKLGLSKKAIQAIQDFGEDGLTADGMPEERMRISDIRYEHLSLVLSSPEVLFLLAGIIGTPVQETEGKPPNALTNEDLAAMQTAKLVIRLNDIRRRYWESVKGEQ